MPNTSVKSLLKRFRVFCYELARALYQHVSKARPPDLLAADLPSLLTEEAVVNAKDVDSWAALLSLADIGKSTIFVIRSVAVLASGTLLQPYTCLTKEGH